MANTKKLIGAAVFSLALAGGGAAGALLGTPSLSGAQESTTTTTVATGARPHGGRGPGLAVAADAIGISEDALRAALEAGKTMAEVATDNGVDVDTVIDALVADATTDLRERITAMVNGQLPTGGPHGRGGRGGGMRGGAGLDAAATALGVTTDELRAALESGQSIAEVAEENGVDVQAVVDAIVQEASAHLDEAVADGRLTEEEAAEREADLEERITEMVNRAGGRRGGGRGARP